MIVWGGVSFSLPYDVYLNTGGRYDPSTNSWTATSTTNAPSARAWHTAVWTGSEMIVWGGSNDLTPAVDTIRPRIVGQLRAPPTHLRRELFTQAVWTDSEMIVWGGEKNNVVLNTGGRYNPSTNSWTATSTTNAPSARAFHKGSLDRQ